MDNNINFISSIKIESDFEELVRRFVQKIFNAEAYLVGGPYDGGRDLVYSIRGREKRTAMQISIQEKNLEAKITKDLEKVISLVDDHDYPAVLYFFWSHPISASREDTIKTDAISKYGITIEFFDAKKMAQKITHDYPDILRYLLEKIHSYSPSKNSDLNLKERALYEYLALSKDAASLRSVVVESQIASSLFENEMTRAELIEYGTKLGVNKGKTSAIISELLRKNRIIEIGGKISLSMAETDRIESIATRDALKKEEVLLLISDTLLKYTEFDASAEIFELIKSAYAASVEIQISEANFEPPKLALVKKCAAEIGNLLRDKCDLDIETAKAVTHELISKSGENDYLSHYCSSRLCLGLLNQKKLEKYIENKRFFIYLDAPVLIRYLCFLRFSDLEEYDPALKVVKSLRDNINHLNDKVVRATVEHFEETVRHLEHAEKISRFANDEVLAALGDSKNIFFNIYLKRKKIKSKNYNFASFLEELIGYESDSGNIKFQDLLACGQKFLNYNRLEIIGSRFTPDESTETEIIRKYRTSLDAQRKYLTIKNDIAACYILSDDELHLDENDVGQTPLLITWDSTQHGLRNIFRQKYNAYAEWLIYTPQRAIERLSMIALNIQSTTLKDGVLAIIDEDFFRDSKNSLLDTLGIFLGDDPVESGALTSLLTKLGRRITDESHDSQHAEMGVRNTLNEVLLYTFNEFRPEFDHVRQLFSDEQFSSLVYEMLKDFSAIEFNDGAKSKYTTHLRDLLTKKFTSN